MARAPSPCAPARSRLPHWNVLVLQGGGALGSYHLGVCETLARLGIAPDWVCGISIGAINAAIIAGNPQGQRIPALARFWKELSSGLAPPLDLPPGPVRDAWSEGAAFWVATTGIPGFFRPRIPPARLQPRGTPEAISHYDTTPLRDTLGRLVDWDLLNDGPMRLSVGAVSVTTGRIHFFDTAGGRDHTRITADHVLASAALPPGFPPVRIGDDWFWDGGIASNAPLAHVIDESTERDKNIFQVDLFPAEGPFPETLLDAEQRAQDIRFASRTRLNTRFEEELAPVRLAVRRLLADCKADLGRLSAGERETLARFACEQHVDIAQIIYRQKAYSGKARGYEFSRPTMEAHRAAGRRDAERALTLRDWTRPPPIDGIRCLDIADAPDRTPEAA